MTRQAVSAGHFVRRVLFDEPQDAAEVDYAVELPVVRALRAQGGFELSPGITAIVGENGSGKSTIVEAVAVAAGLNPEGGSRSFRFHTQATESGLGRLTRLVRAPGRERSSYFLRAESFYNVASELDRLDGGSRELLGGYGGRSLHARSHGEAFLDLLRHRFGARGLYVLDEPEAALSPATCLAAVAIIDGLVRRGSQFVIATHSPILLAIPGTRILEIDGDELREVAYDECRTVSVMRNFLASPERSLRHLLADG